MNAETTLIGPCIAELGKPGRLCCR